jgi:hypothetical protein
LGKGLGDEGGSSIVSLITPTSDSFKLSTTMTDIDSNPKLNLQPSDQVCLVAQPPYLKTADPMPMLRPPDLVSVGETGIVLEIRAGGMWAVKFKSGVFLMDEQYLAIPSPSESLQ